MIFGFEIADKVLAGEKTETRRRGRGDESCRYVPGRDYAVQRGRGMYSEGRVLVASVEREVLGLITDEGARREGFEDRAAFFRYWAGLHGYVNMAERVWVISFSLESVKRRRGGASLLALSSEARSL